MRIDYANLNAETAAIALRDFAPRGGLRSMGAWEPAIRVAALEALKDFFSTRTATPSWPAWAEEELRASRREAAA